ncbi:MAG: hypothetical protein ACRDPI_05035 [Nocardioidaceae bacterium]
MTSPVVRRAVRSLALTPAIVVLVAAGPAFAEAPQAWEHDPKVNKLHALLILGAIPLGLFVLIWVLASLPYMLHGQTYHPGLAWRNEPEWFGGPDGGVDKLDTEAPAESEPPDDTGGASARW